MGIKTEKTQLIETFKDKESFTVNDLHSFFSKMDKDIKRATVNWRIYELVNLGILKRTGRGIYTLGHGQLFSCPIHKKQKNLSLLISKNFPLISYCSWSSTVLNEFYHHISKNQFLIVEVEKDAVDPVYFLLRNEYKNVLRKPTAAIVEEFDFLINKDAVIVKSLISEAPLQNIQDIAVPTLEKILVDLYADTDTFYYLQGNEIVNVYRNALDKYTMNNDRLLRYAKRRSKDKEIRNMLHLAINNQ